MENEIPPFEDDIRRWAINNKTLLLMFLYIVFDLAIIGGGMIARTNLAGPGLDLIVFFFVFPFSMILIVINLYKVFKLGRKYGFYLLIHSLGCINLIVALSLSMSLPTYFSV